MWARLENGRVVELVRDDPTGLHATELQWVPVPPHLRQWVTYQYVLTSDGISPPSAAVMRNQLLAALADRRWREESKGALIGTHRYHTDQASQSKLTAALIMGQMMEAAHGAGSYQVTWKTMDGWADLDLAALTHVAMTCGAHVQTAFAREAAIGGLIIAASDWQTALQAFDSNINTGWPA